jgi:hypothetical protein
MSAKDADARRQASKELARFLGGALDTAAVLRGFLQTSKANPYLSALVFRLALAASALLLLGYGMTNLNLNRLGGTAKVEFCRLWLCPAEFSPDQVYELRRATRTVANGYAVCEFARALEQDPGSAVRWAEFAEALSSRNGSLAAFAMERAIERGPHSAAILARAGNYFFVHGDFVRSVFYWRQLLSTPDFTDYYSAAFVNMERMHIPAAEMLAHNIPAQPLVAQAYLRFEMQSGKPSEAKTVWNWIRAHGFDDEVLTNEYLNFLLTKDMAAEAAGLWAQVKGNIDREFRRSNWVFSSHFQTIPGPGVFDWKVDSASGAQIRLVESEGSPGKPQLEIDFNGDENLNFRDVHQELVLWPGKWRLAVRMKTDELTTDQGIGCRIFDPDDSSRLDIRTDTLMGTNGWVTVEKSFTVGAHTQAARLEFFREPSIRFDNKIRGTVWIEAVSVSPLQ